MYNACRCGTRLSTALIFTIPMLYLVARTENFVESATIFLPVQGFALIHMFAILDGLVHAYLLVRKRFLLLRANFMPALANKKAKLMSCWQRQACSMIHQIVAYQSVLITSSQLLVPQLAF